MSLVLSGFFRQLPLYSLYVLGGAIIALVIVRPLIQGTNLPRWLRESSFVDDVLWAIRVEVVVIVLAGSILTIAAGRFDLPTWGRLLVTGLALGSVYALLALGYTLVYGILFMINFAHGDVFMVGMFMAYFVALPFASSGFLNAQPILSLLILFLIAGIASSGTNVIVERVAYRPLRGAPRLVPLITAIGTSFFLEYAFLGLFGSDVKRYPDIEMFQEQVKILGVTVLKAQVLVIAAAIIMMIVLYWFVQSTKIGKSMRAVAEDKAVAALMGIDVDRVITMTFAIGGALAGIAAILYVQIFGQFNFMIGFIPGVKAFTAAVLGGIGNIRGAMLGGLVLGIIEAVGPVLFFSGLDVPSYVQLNNVIAFTMLVVILIFRPTGILGEQLSEEKA
jgi:branched-chain amino acid transport system permease protein